MEETKKIAVIGLGYVGLPLAIAFAEKHLVVGYDIDTKRIDEIMLYHDATLEISGSELKNVLAAQQLLLSDDIQAIQDCQIFIITVPTPINQFKSPDLEQLLTATRSVASVLKQGDIVVYESTVYPGCTEEDCVPVLEKYSGLTYNTDFFCGYSPERINPGDKTHTLTTIQKVTSGSTPEIATEIDMLYRSIIRAGTYKASSMKVAEASKAIENAQRDLNISFMNELALIFDRMGIDTTEVLEAAATKWNFLKFKPGLVGGHCIGVDPYYLTHKAQQLGYNPQVILSGRTVNDGMGAFVARKIVKLMIQKDVKIKGAKVLVLGFTFKENCPDTRNTKVIDVVNELKEFGVDVDVYDPYASKETVREEFGLSLPDSVPNFSVYNGVIVTVAHDEFLKIDFAKIKRQGTVIFDTKSFLAKELVDSRL
jgi:UDP-N-acetyl-D-galactosamine dehydrogenase